MIDGIGLNPLRPSADEDLHDLIAERLRYAIPAIKRDVHDARAQSLPGQIAQGIVGLIGLIGLLIRVIRNVVTGPAERRESESPVNG
jgi:hypothetical protein